MIALLSGKPVVQQDQVIMMVHGVGYGVAVGAKTLGDLSGKPEATLYIYTHVREDALELFGFAQLEEKELFKQLMSVSGVGPRTALGIVDFGAQRVVQAIQTADVSLFTSVPRVGKKVAQKIIIDLKSKLGSLQELNLGPRSPLEQDVSDALAVLGFSDTEIQRGLSVVADTEETDVAVLVKQAIKQISAHKPR
jgi:Holliday junction DNA helicase RuvA